MLGLDGWSVEVSKGFMDLFDKELLEMIQKSRINGVDILYPMLNYQVEIQQVDLATKYIPYRDA